jgi:hypothetical protein
MSAAPKKWENQPDLFSVPHSRWNSPETSRQAAESIPLERVSLTQTRVIEVYRWNGWEMCDERLVELYLGYWPDSATDQSIRSRRGELVPPRWKKLPLVRRSFLADAVL